jgi:hypothetical protein
MSISRLNVLLLSLMGAGAAMPCPTLVAADLLAATAVQDEPRKMPEDNTAYFSRADRKVRFQLVKLSGVGGEMLAGTKVKVIGPTGGEADLVADANGEAVLEGAQPGLHALVVTGENGHTAVPVALRESGPAADPAMVAAAPVVKLPLIDVDPQEVVRLTSSYLSPDLGGAYEDIDSDFVMNSDVSQGLQYRIRLDDDGSMTGQVYSVLRSGLSTFGVEGTNILIYQDNALVARTTADQLGRFTVPNMTPGFYGLCAAGPAGYAAYGFEAYNAAVVATNDSNARTTLVSTRDKAISLASADLSAAPGTTAFVLLIPPSLLPPVVAEIRNAGIAAAAGGDGMAAGFPGEGGVPGAGPGVPGASGFGSVPASGAVGGGFGGAPAAGGIGGIGAIAGLAGLAAITAAVIDDDDDDPVDATPGFRL